jgi:putative ABC transport system ATP-binding protein
MIELKDITKVYRTGSQALEALRGVSLAIGRGEFVSVMGPSGSGKSTLMNIIGCLDTPTAGEYRLDGDRVAGLSFDELAAVRNRKIGFVFQNFNLLPYATAWENVELPMLFDGKNAKARRRRLADEPTGNLDSKSGEEIMALLADLWRGGRTIVMVTHNDHIAAMSERTIRLFDGQVLP